MDQLLNSEIIICISKIFSQSVVIHCLPTALNKFALLAPQVSRENKLATQVSRKIYQHKLVAEISSWNKPHKKAKFLNCFQYLEPHFLEMLFMFGFAFRCVISKSEVNIRVWLSQPKSKHLT
jgi:hypothetical protein